MNEFGKYSRQLGYGLEDKFVLGEGQDEVLKMLKKHVLLAYPYVHSYPYDWRTKKVRFLMKLFRFNKNLELS